MTRHVSLALASLGLISPSLSAQAPFEGVVTLQMTMKGVSTQPVVYVKGHLSRANMNLGGQESYMITDGQKQTMTMVMPGQRMYMVMALEDVADKVVSPRTARTVAELEPTGKTETIAGIRCEHYVSVDDAKETDVCLAKGIGSFLGIGGGPPRGRGPSAGQNMPSVVQRLAAKFKNDAFVLKMETKEAGTTTLSFEVTKLEKKSVDAAMLTVPEGFQDMSGMMQGLPGQRPPGGR